MKLLVSFFAVLFFAFSASAQKPTPTPAPSPDPDKLPFLMAVEDTFYIAGRGAIIVGKIEQGVVKTGDSLELVGIKPTKTIKVSGIEMFRKLLDEAKTGDNVGLLVTGIERTEAERGQIVAKPGSIKAATKFEATLDLKPTTDGGRRFPLANNYRGQFYLRVVDISGTVALKPGTASLEPGTSGSVVTITLEKPIALTNGQAFFLREAGRATGSGKITKIIE